MSAKSPITCHVLDASVGRPASAVKVSLIKLGGSDAESSNIASGATDNDGRCTTLLPSDTKLSAGAYKMVFHIEPYFKEQDKTSFYPLVEISFNYTNPEQHYHIPLLISPFSYTTYRGS